MFFCREKDLMLLYIYNKQNLQILFEFIWPCLKSSSNLLCLYLKRNRKGKDGKKTSPNAFLHSGPSIATAA
jgi:hypothetical protein